MHAVGWDLEIILDIGKWSEASNAEREREMRERERDERERERERERLV